MRLALDGVFRRRNRGDLWVRPVRSLARTQAEEACGSEYGVPIRPRWLSSEPVEGTR